MKWGIWNFGTETYNNDYYPQSLNYINKKKLTEKKEIFNVIILDNNFKSKKKHIKALDIRYIKALS